MAPSDKYSDPQANKVPIDAELSDDDEGPDPEEVSHAIDNGEQGQASGSTSNKKKKKKKSKAKKILDGLNSKNVIQQAVLEKVVAKVTEDAAPGSENIDAEDVREVLQQIKIMDVMKGKSGIGGNNRKDVGEHKFWRTQPVPQLGDAPPEADGYIEPSKPREEVRQEPYPLPADFEWATIDMNNSAQTKEVYDLLSLNYVEDDNASFRFKYSAEFLAWALKPPGYSPEWHIGVRVSKTKKLVAFISGVPMTLRVRENSIRATEINFLCVHKKLRSKRLAPVLIKEVTRQVHLKGIFQAIYTAGVVIPTPISTCQYYHRLLNVPKLLDTKFCYVPRSMTLARMMRVNRLPETTSIPGLREMEEKDIVRVTQLFLRYMKRFGIAPAFSVEEARHQFLSGSGTSEPESGGPGRREGQVTWSYVVEDPKTKKITDFFSFYYLPSTVIDNHKHALLEAAYLYYYATDAGVIPHEDQDQRVKNRLTSLITDCLIIANNAKFDVFNALTLMDNVPILRELKFGVGDGFLNFYLYNWRTKPLSGMRAEGDVPPGKGVGVVML